MTQTNADSPRPVALVTGASGGIGRACAEALAAAREPCDVAVHYNSSGPAAEETARALSTQFGVRAHAFQADLGQPGAAEKLVEEVANTCGPPSILVHAAGHLLEKPIAFTSAQDWDALFEVHVFSAAALTKALARHLRN